MRVIGSEVLAKLWRSAVLMLTIAGAIGLTPTAVRAEPSVLLGISPNGPLQTDSDVIEEIDTPRIFADVFPVDPFDAGAGVSDFSSFIERLYTSGIANGCGNNPLRYCPDDNLTRNQMAVFLIRGILGSQYEPPPAVGLFDDVPVDDPFAPWIEALADADITGGCGVGTYCPGSAVTRRQMAVFLMRAMQGAGFKPLKATGTRFGDVPADDPYAPWIEALADFGITSGCGGGNYCPDVPVTRDQMAVFLVKVFGL